MNKKELVQEISKKIDVPQTKVDDIVRAFMEVVTKTLKAGDKVTLVGFGTFMVKRRKATSGINPQTKKRMEIPAKNYAKLQFSEKVNELFN